MLTGLFDVSKITEHYFINAEHLEFPDFIRLILTRNWIVQTFSFDECRRRTHFDSKGKRRISPLFRSKKNSRGRKFSLLFTLWTWKCFPIFQTSSSASFFLSFFPSVHSSNDSCFSRDLYYLIDFNWLLLVVEEFIWLNWTAQFGINWFVFREARTLTQILHNIRNIFLRIESWLKFIALWGISTILSRFLPRLIN